MALPADDLFDVDEFLCIAMAKRLSGYSTLTADSVHNEDQLQVELTFGIAVASICHQFNWDFLNKRLSEKLLPSAGKDLVSRLAAITTRDFQEWFQDFPEPARIRASERARMLREVASVLRNTYDGDARALLERSKFTLAGPTGFYALMDTIPAFREDPLRKKTNVVTHDVVRRRLARFTDEENIAPAVDYHLIRIYLRTGRVCSKHVTILQDLASADPRPRPRLVRVLREKVAEAVRLTARFSGLTVPDVNYIEWQLGRTICVRDRPKCIAGIRVAIDPGIAKLFEGVCPFVDNCMGYRNPRWMELQEPVFTKTFY